MSITRKPVHPCPSLDKLTKGVSGTVNSLVIGLRGAQPVSLVLSMTSGITRHIESLLGQERGGGGGGGGSARGLLDLGGLFFVLNRIISGIS